MPFLSCSTHLKSTEPVSAQNHISSTIYHHQILKINKPSQPTHRHHKSIRPVHPTKPNEMPTTNPHQPCPPQCQEPTTQPSAQTSCATETLSRRRQHLLLLLLPTASHATRSNAFRLMNGAGALCAGEPNSAWSWGGV